MLRHLNSYAARGSGFSDSSFATNKDPLEGCLVNEILQSRFESGLLHYDLNTNLVLIRKY